MAGALAALVALLSAIAVTVGVGIDRLDDLRDERRADCPAIGEIWSPSKHECVTPPFTI